MPTLDNDRAAVAIDHADVLAQARGDLIPAALYARVTGRSHRTVLHWIRTGHLPARRLGARWFVERSRLPRQ